MNCLKDRVYQFLVSLPKITLSAGTVLYHGTNLKKIKLTERDHDKLFMSLNQIEAVRHALRKTYELKIGRPYLHTYRLKNDLTVCDFTELTRNANVEQQYKWDVINRIVTNHGDNYQMEQTFFDLLKVHSELHGYYDGCDQCVVLLAHPHMYIDRVNVQSIKSLTQNDRTIKIKRHEVHSVTCAYQMFDRYYHAWCVNHVNPSPVYIRYDHTRARWR